MNCSVIKYSNHAVEYMAMRGINENEIEQVAKEGEVIEEYPDDKPFPSVLVFSIIKQRPIHIVMAYEMSSATCIVITAYEPSLEKFEPDFKTRKKKS